MLFYSGGISGEVGYEAINYRKLVYSQKECKEKQIRLQAYALVSAAPVAAHFPTQALVIKSLQFYHSFDGFKKSKHAPTSLAAGQLSDVLNGGDEVYANCMVIDQVGDLDINYINIEGLSAHMSPESMRSTLGPQACRHIPPPDCSPCGHPLGEDSEGPASTATLQPCVSPASSCTSQLNLPFGLHEFEKEQSHLKKRSSSLDALNADSEGEGHSQPPICYAVGSSRTGLPSGDELDSFETSAEADCNISRTESLSLSSTMHSKESLLSGIRSRSYSCSSPKVSVGKPRLVRDFTVCSSTEEQRSYSFTEPPGEKRIQEEEWEEYIIPAKSESEKYKVSRTFSFLMNRMTSPRNKSKMKNKEAKDKEKPNRHQFVPGTFSGVLQCSGCEKTLLGKESLQCASSSLRDAPQPGLSLHPSSSMPIGLPAGRKEAAGQVHPLSRSVPGTTLESFRRSVTSLELEGDSTSWRSRSHSDELYQSMGSSPSTESFMMEDVVDSSLWSDLSSDAQEFEAESWSLVVDPSFCSRQEKEVIKRQDVIFELMQTEVHHMQTLLIMSEVFRKGMKEELQLDHSTVDKIFPCLDELLETHRHFFFSMKERRQESCMGNDRNFVINRIGDILVQQIRNSNLLARRRGIPECILLVTQRITKYPVLVERILQYTKERTEEHKDLCKALGLIKDMIAAVDLKVSEYEKNQKWLEILNKIENKTYTKLKNGHVFRKQALMTKERALLHDGLVYWKTATGRFKDILALLLTDVLLFLQEKDQKYIFAAVDQKPSVISLQKLIAREVANEERGMFLISASSAGPEMYEIHTNSKEERNNWMRRIQQAVESLQVAVKASKMGDGSQSPSPEEGSGGAVLTDAFSSQDVPASPTASLVTEGTEGRGCWDVDPGLQGVVTDLAVSDAGEKAALTIQDSHIEIHKLVLQQRESLAFFRGGPLQDQEKSRYLEKQREELANIHKLQHQFQQEQRRWHRLCDQQQREQEAQESWLQARERECQSQEELLLRHRSELDHQLQEYQQSLERLREGQRMVERERQRMRVQQGLLGHCKHSRQRSLPAVFSPENKEVMELNRAESLCQEDSFFINEALVHMSLNTSNKPNPSGVPWDTYPPGVSPFDLVRTSDNQTELKRDVSQPPDVNHELWTATGPSHEIPALQVNVQDSCKNAVVPVAGHGCLMRYRLLSDMKAAPRMELAISFVSHHEAQSVYFCVLDVEMEPWVQLPASPS
ncbi:Rho guanine nucleotide exchange factor 28 [Microtus ochrogaster]|uniref:Rho guanine nucleotide exchange factor 28 n=1 Tax=Microtus ochrogaster TaxID=79684 RepID=A0A8J6KXI8_MICOH|nr:Rho guanine nucleotide exchange factor 28 [Microtus ochrogaster]